MMRLPSVLPHRRDVEKTQLVEPATNVEGCTNDSVQEAKRSRVKEMEMKLLESKLEKKDEVNTSWLGSLINTVIGNIKLAITNIHVKYEDTESNLGHPFAAGMTLEKLASVTIGEDGKEAFITGGTLDYIQKSVELEQLAIYFEFDVKPWEIGEPWEYLLPSEWSEIFFLNLESRQKNQYLVDVLPKNIVISCNLYVGMQDMSNLDLQI